MGSRRYRAKAAESSAPPNRAKWSPITRLTNSAWGGGTYSSSAVLSFWLGGAELGSIALCRKCIGSPRSKPRPARPPPGGQPDQPVGFLGEVSSSYLRNSLSSFVIIFLGDLRGRRSRIELLCSKKTNGSEEELDYRLMLERLGQSKKNQTSISGLPKKTLARTRFGLEKRTYDHLLDVRITPVAGSTWFTVSLCPRHFLGIQWGGVLVTIGWSDMR